MALTKNDLKLIRGVVYEVVDEVVEDKVTSIVEEKVTSIVEDKVTSIVVEKVTDIIAENNRTLRNEIIQFKDDILGEIVKLREDVAVVNGYKDQIEDHESRLVTVETKLDISY
jgi:hypothetical protein